MRRYFAMAVCMCSAMLVISGCASLMMSQKEPVQTVLERNPDKEPAWMINDSRTYWVDKTSIMASGASGESNTLQTAVSGAENAANAKLIQGIKGMIDAEYKTALSRVKPDPTTETYLNNTFGGVLSNMQITGITVKEIYSEKVKEMFKKNEKIFYRAYALVEVSNANYDKIILSSVSSLKNEIKSKTGTRTICRRAKRKRRG